MTSEQVILACTIAGVLVTVITLINSVVQQRRKVEEDDRKERDRLISEAREAGRRDRDDEIANLRTRYEGQVNLLTTKFEMAQREIGLLRGSPADYRNLPPGDPMGRPRPGGT